MKLPILFALALAALSASAFADDAADLAADKATLRDGPAHLAKLGEVIPKSYEPARTQYIEEAMREMGGIMNAAARQLTRLEKEAKTSSGLIDYLRESNGRLTTERDDFKKKYFDIVDLGNETVAVLRKLQAQVAEGQAKIADNQQRMLAVKQVEEEAAKYKALYEAEKLKSAQAYLDGKNSVTTSK